MVHLEVGEDGRAAGAPVHHPAVAVGEPLVVELAEDAAHRLRARPRRACSTRARSRTSSRAAGSGSGCRRAGRRPTRGRSRGTARARGRGASSRSARSGRARRPSASRCRRGRRPGPRGRRAPASSASGRGRPRASGRARGRRGGVPVTFGGGMTSVKGRASSAATSGRNCPDSSWSRYQRHLEGLRVESLVELGAGRGRHKTGESKRRLGMRRRASQWKTVSGGFLRSWCAGRMDGSPRPLDLGDPLADETLGVLRHDLPRDVADGLVGEELDDPPGDPVDVGVGESAGSSPDRRGRDGGLGASTDFVRRSVGRKRASRAGAAGISFERSSRRAAAAISSSSDGVVRARAARDALLRRGVRACRCRPGSPRR